jgi:Phage tail lysozyme
VIAIAAAVAAAIPLSNAFASSPATNSASGSATPAAKGTVSATTTGYVTSGEFTTSNFWLRQEQAAAAASLKAKAKAAAAAKAKAEAAAKAKAEAEAKAKAQQKSATISSAKTLSCSGSSGMLPANYATIVNFLVGHGYTAIAAAGIAGNIYQESGGNPESEGDGGGGLIGWTPLPSGYVTGNVSADLQTQLNAILAFNDIWAAYIPALNAASSPAEAAEIYVTDFERAGIPATSNRVAAAEAVAAACGI